MRRRPRLRPSAADRRADNVTIPRREWEQRPPEERIAGKLQFWLLGQRHKGHEPTSAEIAARRAALLAELAELAAGEQPCGTCPGPGDVG
jgi:hypothetical protein